MKRCKKLLRSVEFSFWQRPNFVWAPLIPALIMGGASIAGSVVGGVFGKMGADAQVKATERINKQQMEQTERWNKIAQANYEREEKVKNLNTILAQDTGLKDRLTKIWGGSQRRGVL